MEVEASKVHDSTTRLYKRLVVAGPSILPVSIRKRIEPNELNEKSDSFFQNSIILATLI